MPDTDKPNPPNYFDFWSFDFWKGLAPQTLSQPILPGLLGITINQTNSSAPDTEQKILARDSYGRQIGKLMDAVAELIKAQADDNDKLPEAYEELLKLKDRVDQAKLEAAHDRIDRIKSDLATLKAHNHTAYQSFLKDLGDIIQSEKAWPIHDPQAYDKMRHTL